MDKDIRNADAIIHKFEPASIRATNNRLNVAQEKSRKNRLKEKKAESWSYGCKTLKS